MCISWFMLKACCRNKCVIGEQYAVCKPLLSIYTATRLTVLHSNHKPHRVIAFYGGRIYITKRTLYVECCAGTCLVAPVSFARSTRCIYHQTYIIRRMLCRYMSPCACFICEIYPVYHQTYIIRRMLCRYMSPCACFICEIYPVYHQTYIIRRMLCRYMSPCACFICEIYPVYHQAYFIRRVLCRYMSRCACFICEIYSVYITKRTLYVECCAGTCLVAPVSFVRSTRYISQNVLYTSNAEESFSPFAAAHCK